MRERICGWQQTMVELNLRVALSHCTNKKCDSYFTFVFPDLCKTCDQKKPVFENDSLKLASFIKHRERSDVVIEALLTAHCRKCDKFSESDSVCEVIRCSKPYPISSLMQNPAFICKLGMWK